MGKSAASKQAVAEYYMSIMGGICTGPVDAITGLYVGEKLAWEGEVTDQGPIQINAPSLFGGNKDGGGVGGIMYYLPGGPMQILPNALAQRMGLTSNTSPGYRGVASVFFIGLDGVPTGSVDTDGGGSSSSGGTVGGDGGGGGGSGGSCPVTWARVLLANANRDGPGDTREAGALRPGADWVWTQHERTMAWGAHPVSRKRLVEEDLWQTADHMPPTSASHLWWIDDEWQRADKVGEEIGETGTVVALTVTDAHTYIVVDDEGGWHLSHNKTTQPIDQV